ncbi:MAG: hypothetical protein LBQ39_07925 [Tannerellaceae bacterium]|jgi:hypothetical protein|nr:hypothetical protein [Tannerellaceae bacterium]
MIHIILKNQIEQSKLDVLLSLLKSWDIDTEIKATAKRVKKTVSKSDEKHELFSKTFGMWKDRDIDLKQIRQQAMERRTRTVSKSTEKDDLFAETRGMWADYDIDAKELRRRASDIDKRLGLTNK